MARKPEHRPASATAMANELSQLGDGTDRERLAVIVTETLARRASLADTTPNWATGDADDLPETVGLPLHELNPPVSEEWPGQPLPNPLATAAPQEPAEEVVPPATVQGASHLPVWITAAALGLTAAILGFAILQRWFG